MSEGKRQLKSEKPKIDWNLWWEKNQKKMIIGMGIAAALMITLAVALSFWIRLPDVPVRETEVTTGDELGDLPSITVVPSKTEGLERRDGVYTFIVVGRDTSAGLTDTMILVTYDTVNKTIDAMSLPRDTMVNVSTDYKKLNGVYSLNKGSDKDLYVETGMTALKTVVEDLTGIYPDFYVMVEWDAVGELVDALDGVWFDVPYNMDYDDPEQDLYIHQAAGYRLLTGDDAMQVIRHRQNNDGSYSNGDVGRIAVQQDFLMAVAEQCLTPTILLKASSLIDIFLEQVTTDLTVGNLLAFAQSAYGINVSEDVHISTMPYLDYYRYSSYVLPVEEELVELLNSGLNPYTTDISANNLELLYKIDSSGSLGVTNGELKDSSLADAIKYTSSSSSTTTTTTEDETETETDSDTELDADVETDVDENGDSLDEVDPFAQPEPELPDPDTTTEDVTTETPTVEETPVVEESAESTSQSTDNSSILELLF